MYRVITKQDKTENFFLGCQPFHMQFFVLNVSETFATNVANVLRLIMNKNVLRNVWSLAASVVTATAITNIIMYKEVPAPTVQHN